MKRTPEPRPADLVDPITVDELARRYLEAARATSRPSSLETKADLLRLHILPSLGARPVEAVDAATVAALAESKLAKRSHKTVINILSCLRQVLAFGAEQGIVAELPQFPRQHQPKPRIRPALSDDDAARLVEAAEPDWRAMVALARSGLRLGELLGLRWRDVDLSKKTVAIRRTLVRGRIGPPERNRPRKIELDDQAVAALGAHRRDRRHLVFCDEHGGPLTADQTHRHLWRACDRANLSRIRWDGLRKRTAGRPTPAEAPSSSPKATRLTSGSRARRSAPRPIHCDGCVCAPEQATLQTASAALSHGLPVGFCPPGEPESTPDAQARRPSCG